MTDTHPDPRDRRAILDALENLWKAASGLEFLHTCEDEGLRSGQPTPEDWRKARAALDAALRGAFPEWTCPICHAQQGHTPNAAICDNCQSQNHRITGDQP
jgi:hypothetical protein